MAAISDKLGRSTSSEVLKVVKCAAAAATATGCCVWNCEGSVDTEVQCECRTRKRGENLVPCVLRLSLLSTRKTRYSLFDLVLVVLSVYYAMAVLRSAAGKAHRLPLGAGVKMEHFQAALDPRKQELLEARFLGARVSVPIVPIETKEPITTVIATQVATHDLHYNDVNGNALKRGMKMNQVGIGEPNATVSPIIFGEAVLPGRAFARDRCIMPDLRLTEAIDVSIGRFTRVFVNEPMGSDVANVVAADDSCERAIRGVTRLEYGF
ncbi:unnamed protein product [Phaedon cochleariae]|uniref:Uncharacterized protein n=1 Tax=Phaedon cochleariae TaxID=80249 RepID=A0A9N9X2X0_PHACE|nr:unnamed protein product [Phaedon cochleariae]